VRLNRHRPEGTGDRIKQGSPTRESNKGVTERSYGKELRKESWKESWKKANGGARSVAVRPAGLPLACWP